MADKITTVDYYYVECNDKPGAGSALMEVFKKARVNMLAVHAFPSNRKVQVDLVPKDGRAFLKAANTVGMKVSEKKKAFLATGKDQIGVAARILGQLGDNNVNVTAMTAIAAGKGQYGAIFWVKPKDFSKAKKILKAK
jgi:hypothetical protein